MKNTGADKCDFTFYMQILFLHIWLNVWGIYLAIYLFKQKKKYLKKKHNIDMSIRFSSTLETLF